MSVPQLPLALRPPTEQRLDLFVSPRPGLVERLRGLARAGADEALYLQGGSGSGKSHLLLATCAEAEASGRRAAYLSLRAAAGRLAEAATGLEAADLVALDDLAAIAGDAADERALFALHNRLRDARRCLLYAAADAPDALGIALPDLRSRLAQATRIRLPALDDAGRAELLRRRAAARGLEVDPAALEWLLRRCGRDLRGLTALLDRLDAAALAAQRRLTVPFLRQVLGPDPA
ncbi:DnaA regulatory inactivator Hda [Thermomonas flagellata]|uniref:DnaA regulatory inactivator Hda n=1 Tax=Thermomonas flagellata TaxID=2888524 RepID=UPI001F04DB33|nr:DnaA regulatory inactivator Hda [Thermomonas flagellata]